MTIPIYVTSLCVPQRDRLDKPVMTVGLMFASPRVMRGLDPRIHDALQGARTLQPLLLRKVIMDGRDEPGHDGCEVARSHSLTFSPI